MSRSQNQQILLFKKSFTLLEILVVIGIIAVLVAMGTASYSTAQKKARDAKRRGDLKAIQNALEQYYSICGYNYPFSSSGNLPLTISTTNPPCSSATTILTVPKDPLGGYYRCVDSCSSSAYTICPPASVNGGKMLETADCSDKSCCVSNQQ